jgi:hypothetical protein
VPEESGRGLQNLLQQCKSAPDLKKLGPVAELVYAQHLKCCVHKTCGFESHLDHLHSFTLCKPMRKESKSSHILNASSNLVGFSFLVFTTIQVFNIAGITIIDEVAALGVFLFSASSLFSFLSIRADIEKRSMLYENIADVIFFTGLLLILIASVFIAFSIIK